MKYVIAAALSLASVFAFAADAVDAKQSAATGQRLDVAKVISITPAEDPLTVSGVIDVEMVYLDSQGDTRTLHYKVLGDARQNG